MTPSKILQNIKLKYLIQFFVVILLELFFTSSVFAGTGLTIQPIKISHTINPGEEVSGVIALTNASSDSNDTMITLQTQDFIPSIGTDGITFVGRAPGVTTAVDWITLGKNGEKTFLIKKGESRGIPYTIKAPLGAEPGGHYGVLFFRANKIAEGQQLNVGTQVGVLLLITVPGSHLEKGRVLDFTTSKTLYKESPVDFKVRFENTGTVHYEPKGDVTIYNMLGKVVATIPVQGNIVLPSGIREFPIVWNYTGMILGRYRATISILNVEGDNIDTKTVVFYAMPIWFIVEFFGSVFAVYFILRFLKKRVKITFKP